MSSHDEMHFYESKGKLIFLMLMSIVFIIIFTISTVVTLNDEAYVYTVFSILGGGFFAVCCYLLLKKISTKNPYLSLSNTHLTIYMFPSLPIAFAYQDIEKFLSYQIMTNKFIGIQLINEEKYNQEIPDKVAKLFNSNVSMGYPKYNIVLNNIKEREVMLQELESRWKTARPRPEEANTEQQPPAERTQ